MKEYITLKEEASDEFIVEKSRFIGQAKPVKSVEEAELFINKAKKKYWDARHNAWAYIIGENQGVMRFSDDGEVPGTAGIPTLEVMKKMGLTDCVCVVTRYFGGIKLGSGGLIRAYTQGAKIGLLASKPVKMVPHVECMVDIDYSFVTKFQRDIPAKGWVVLDSSYSDKVSLKIRLLPDEVNELKNFVNETTSATGNLTVGKEKLVPIEIA